jgi:predicted porin
MKLRTFLMTAGLGMGAAGATLAQSVTLYGVLDSGVEYVNHVGPESRGLTRVPTITGTIPSRWGIRGNEDLGDDIKAIFALESGLGMDNGMLNQGGRLFGLQAWVGLSGKWGQISVGRQLTMLLQALYDTDILGPNIYGIGSFDSYLPNARADNAVAYKGKFGGLTVGAMLSTGRDTVNAGPSPGGMNCAGEAAGNSKVCREWSALLAYEHAGWGGSLAIDTLHGGPGAFGGLASPDQTDKRIMVGAYRRTPKGRFAVSWIRRNNDASVTPRNDLVSAGASRDMLPAFNLAGQVSWLHYRHTANKALLYAVRGTYSLSRRTAVYANVGLIDNSPQLALSVSAGAPGANPVAGASQLGTMLGLRHTF